MRSGPLTATETVVPWLPRRPPPGTRKCISHWGNSRPCKAPMAGAMSRPATRRLMSSSHGRTEDMRVTGLGQDLDASEGYGLNPQPRQRSYEDLPFRGHAPQICQGKSKKIPAQIQI